MVFAYLCMVLGLVSVIAFIYLRVKVGGITALIVKVFPGMFYILLSACAFYVAGYPLLGLFIVIGQIFGLLGDIFLDQKYIHKEHGLIYTHMGFTVFGVGHIFFISGILMTYCFSGIELVIAGIIALLISGFVLVTEKPFKLSYGKLKVDVVLYTLVIGLMTALPAVGAVTYSGKEATLNLIFIGMVLFLLSDLVLSQIYFGINQNKPKNVVLNYIFYYGAQFAISASILFLG